MVAVPTALTHEASYVQSREGICLTILQAVNAVILPATSTRPGCSIHCRLHCVRCLQCVCAGDGSEARWRASGAPRLAGSLQVALGQAARGSVLAAWLCRHSARSFERRQQQAVGARQRCCSSGRAREEGSHDGRRADKCLSITTMRELVPF
jgi:hypothetical protein